MPGWLRAESRPHASAHAAVRSACLTGPEVGPRAGRGRRRGHGGAVLQQLRGVAVAEHARHVCVGGARGAHGGGARTAPQQACQVAAVCGHTAANTLSCPTMDPLYPNPAPCAGHYDEGRHLLDGHCAVGDRGRCAPAACACPTLPYARTASWLALHRLGWLSCALLLGARRRRRGTLDADPMCLLTPPTCT